MKKVSLITCLVLGTLFAQAQKQPVKPKPIDSIAKEAVYTISESELRAIYGAVTDASPLLVKYPASNEKQAAAAFSVLSRLNSVAEYLAEKFNTAHAKKQN